MCNLNTVVIKLKNLLNVKVMPKIWSSVPMRFFFWTVYVPKNVLESLFIIIMHYYYVGMPFGRYCFFFRGRGEFR